MMSSMISFVMKGRGIIIDCIGLSKAKAPWPPWMSF